MRLAIALSFQAPLSARVSALALTRAPCIWMRSVRRLVAHRFAGLQHAHDPFLRLLRAEQIDERLTLEFEQPFFVDEAARFHVTTTHRFRDAAGDQVVVLADETAVAHVDER